MTDKTDLELINLIKDGDQEAAASLVLRYKNVVKRQAAVWNGRIGDYDSDDLYQIGCIHLLHIAPSYDESKNASFPTFLEHCLKNRYSDINRTSKTKPTTVSIDSAINDDQDKNSLRDFIPSKGLSPEEKILEDESSTEFFDKISSFLSKAEISVLNLYLAEFSYREIADKLKLTSKSVGNALYSARKKIKARLNEDCTGKNPEDRK